MVSPRLHQTKYLALRRGLKENQRILQKEKKGSKEYDNALSECKRIQIEINLLNLE